MTRDDPQGVWGVDGDTEAVSLTTGSQIKQPRIFLIQGYCSLQHAQCCLINIYVHL